MLDGGHERAPSKPSAIVHPEKGELEPAFCFTGLLQDLVPSPSQVALVVKNPPANAGNIRDAGSIPGWGRSPGIEQSNLFQYSCLENSIHGQRSLESYSP